MKPAATVYEPSANKIMMPLIVLARRQVKRNKPGSRWAPLVRLSRLSRRSKLIAPNMLKNYGVQVGQSAVERNPKR
jgi:hypothetical protein